MAPRIGLSRGGAGSSNIYGTRPVLPTSGTLANNLSGILNQAIPGFSDLTKSATGIIGSALSGQLPPDVQNIIRDNAATQAVIGGMPGTSNAAGTLYGNKTLRDLGMTSLGRQDAGVKDLIGFLGGVSGAAAPTFGQAQDQENAIAKYASAPDPAAAAGEEERLYNKYSNPAAGTGAGGGALDDERPWWMKSRGIQGSISRTPAFGLGNPSTQYY